MARFITLCSGSSGNAAVVEENGKFLLVDAGLSCRALTQRIQEIGLSQENLCGLLITHEHIDHVKGVGVFTRKNKVPLVSSEATLEALRQKQQIDSSTKTSAIQEGDCVSLEGFCVHAFSVLHDAADCMGFFIQTPKGACMAIVTDIGILEESQFLWLQKAQLVALEANYDEFMIKNGPYPVYLKQRIRSNNGHLCNRDSAAAAAALVVGGCRKLVFCHLSADNNCPECVRTSLELAFLQSGYACPSDCDIQIAPRLDIGRWMSFGEK